MIREIAGHQNHSVKEARKLQKKKYRRDWGLLVGEGLDLLEAAWQARADIREVLVRRDLVGELPPALVEAARSALPGKGPDIGVCDAETLEYASSLGGAADVLFFSAEPAASLADVSLGAGLTFFLAGVGDPGNVGTIVRSMVAFGGAGVLCSPGSADPFSPKALRAGMGAQFLLPIVVEVSAADLRAKLAALAARGGAVPEIWIADPHDGEDVRSLEGTQAAIVVLGDERNGPGPEWADARRITIRQSRFESLNVGMAGTILAYELAADRAVSGK